MSENPKAKPCDIDDIVCQMQALSHLKGLQNVLGDERFRARFPELEGLDERVAERIKEQDSILREALNGCGLNSISEPELETAQEE